MRRSRRLSERTPVSHDDTSPPCSVLKQQTCEATSVAPEACGPEPTPLPPPVVMLNSSEADIAAAYEAGTGVSRLRLHPITVTGFAKEFGDTLVSITVYFLMSLRDVSKTNLDFPGLVAAALGRMVSLIDPYSRVMPISFFGGAPLLALDTDAAAVPAHVVPLRLCANTAYGHATVYYTNPHSDARRNTVLATAHELKETTAALVAAMRGRPVYHTLPDVAAVLLRNPWAIVVPTHLSFLPGGTFGVYGHELQTRILEALIPLIAHLVVVDKSKSKQ